MGLEFRVEGLGFELPTFRSGEMDKIGLCPMFACKNSKTKRI